MFIKFHIWLAVSNIFYFSISYMGCHPTHWRTHIFQDGWNMLLHHQPEMFSHIKSQYYEWENPLFLWPFSTANFVYLPGRVTS